MVAINVGAGIAQMGETVAKATGAAALEQQRSELQKESMVLANRLAGERESTGRREQHGLNLETLDKQQTFQGAEGDKTRATQLEASRISAGASAASSAAHLQGVREQIAATMQLGDFKYNEDGTASMVNKRTGVATPVLGDDGQPKKFANPEKAQAVAKLVETTKDQLNSTVRLYETDLKQAQAELAAALKSPGAMVDPVKDPGVLEAKKAIEAIRLRYEPSIKTLTNRMDQIYSDLGVKSGMPTQGKPGGYDLNKYMKPPPEAAAPASVGIINTPANY